jgi:hypothetical protein
VPMRMKEALRPTLVATTCSPERGLEIPQGRGVLPRTPRYLFPTSASSHHRSPDAGVLESSRGLGSFCFLPRSGAPTRGAGLSPELPPATR